MRCNSDPVAGSERAGSGPSRRPQGGRHDRRSLTHTDPLPPTGNGCTNLTRPADRRVRVSKTRQHHRGNVSFWPGFLCLTFWPKVNHKAVCRQQVRHNVPATAGRLRHEGGCHFATGCSARYFLTSARKMDRSNTSLVSDAEGQQMAEATESEPDFQLPEREPDPQLLLPADLRSEWVVVPRAVLKFQESWGLRVAVALVVWWLSRDLSWSAPLLLFAWLCIELGGGLNARMRTAGTLRGRVFPDPLSYRTPPLPSTPSRGWQRL